MSKLYQKALVIFRRDLRIIDHTALLHAAAIAETIIPCFIVDPRSVEAENQYRSFNAIHFMAGALAALDEELLKRGGRLHIFYGIAEEVVDEILKKEKLQALFVNRDYTPFSLKRDEAIAKVCRTHNVSFFSDHDLLLHEPEELMSGNGTPYVVFTPYYKRALSMPVRETVGTPTNNWYTKPITIKSQSSLRQLATYDKHDAVTISVKRATAVKKLKNIQVYADYSTKHDFLTYDTTRLSPFIKFGVVSIREVYHAIVSKLGLGHPLIRQLLWHDFFTQVAYFSPFVFQGSFKEKYRSLVWDNDKRVFKRWCMGTTGFPIVDAGMRELNATGFMHNRARLITASFLVKDLHIDWRWGERYFATKLIDYDPSVNNGNWQWVASTGTDAQPYFRIFNPWLQQKKYDPACYYIKQWIPELRHVDQKVIHAWYKQKLPNVKYSVPIIDHTRAAAEAKKRYSMRRGI